MLWGYRVCKYRQCLHPYGGSIYPYTVKMIQSTQINIKWKLSCEHQNHRTITLELREGDDRG